MHSDDPEIAKVREKALSGGGRNSRKQYQPLLDEVTLDSAKDVVELIAKLIEFFEQSKIDFISITERFDTSTPAGRLLRNIMLTFAQFERDLSSERTKDKMLERAKKGMCHGGLTPYGYMRQNKKLIPHPKEAGEVKAIFEKYIETKSLFDIYDF